MSESEDINFDALGSRWECPGWTLAEKLSGKKTQKNVNVNLAI